MLEGEEMKPNPHPENQQQGYLRGSSMVEASSTIQASGPGSLSLEDYSDFQRQLLVHKSFFMVLSWYRSLYTSGYRELD
jgi:hypothetical protein